MEENSMVLATRALLDTCGGEYDDWESLDYYPSGVGVEYWYRNKNTEEEVYICIDQDEISVHRSGE